AARAEAGQEAAKREERLRAIGRQLDEEAARRAAMDAERVSPSQVPWSRSGRRYRLFGRSDPNAEVILYAEAWARKIQMNITFDIFRQILTQPHPSPILPSPIPTDAPLTPL